MLSLSNVDFLSEEKGLCELFRNELHSDVHEDICQANRSCCQAVNFIERMRTQVVDIFLLVSQKHRNSFLAALELQ